MRRVADKQLSASQQARRAEHGRDLGATQVRLSGASTKRQVVEDSLRLLIQVKRQERIPES